MFFVFTGAGLEETGAGYRGGDRLLEHGYGSEEGSTQPASKLGTQINQQLSEENTWTLTEIFIEKFLYYTKKLFSLLDPLAPVDGEDPRLPENLTVEMGMRLLDEDEGETEMDTAPAGAATTETTAAPTGATATDQTAVVAAHAAITAANAAAAAAAAKLKASQAISDKLIARAAMEAAERKEQEKKEQAALAAYMAADRNDKDKWSRRGSNDSSDFVSISSSNNSDMPPLYFTTKNKRDNAIKTRILGGGGILLLRGCLDPLPLTLGTAPPHTVTTLRQDLTSAHHLTHKQ